MPPHGLSVYACVTQSLRRRLALLVPQARCTDSLAQLRDCIAEGISTVAFVEPSTDLQFADRVLELRTARPACTFVVYAVLRPDEFHVLLRLASAGIRDVVLSGFDDTHGRIESLLAEIASRHEFPVVAAALKPHMERLPVPLRRAITEMFQHPARFRSSNDVARAARMSQRAVFRHLGHAGFTSARKLIAAARLLLSYRLLCGQNRSVREVAARLGYASSDQLSHHLMELAGCTASELRRGLLPAHDFCGAIVEALIARQSIEPLVHDEVANAVI
jgi:AraC-like DNA-binding protein